MLFNLSWALEELGDLERAHELVEELLTRARATGHTRYLAFALDISSSHARDAGRLDEAYDAARGGLRIRRDQGDVQHMLDGLSRVAAIHAHAGVLDRAAELLSSSVRLHEERGRQVPLYQEQRNEMTLQAVRTGLDASALAGAEERGKGLTLDDAVALALGEEDDRQLSRGAGD